MTFPTLYEGLNEFKYVDANLDTFKSAVKHRQLGYGNLCCES